MTIAMPDSIYPDRLPPGYRAYLGYVDGRWPTLPALKSKFPGAHTIGLTVFGGTLDADGVDCEPRDPSAISAAEWIARKLTSAPGFRPVAYADLASPGYRMREVLADLAALGIGRERVRLLTAHYTQAAHICGPKSCGELAVDADGTQWTSSFAGVGGQAIDMSELADDFFGAPAPRPAAPQWPANVILREGDTGGAVRVLQQALHDSGAYGARGLEPVDGIFGPHTLAAVRNFQADKRLMVDGIAGPQTRAALLS